MIDPMETKLKSFLCFVLGGPAFEARRSMGGNKLKTSLFGQNPYLKRIE